jgi:WD40 repeat protein
LALSGQLAGRSRTLFEEDPTQGLLLAIEALNMTLETGDPVAQPVEEALWDMLSRLGGRGLADYSGLIGSDQAMGIRPLTINANSRWLVTVNDRTDNLSLWDLNSPHPAANRVILPDDPQVHIAIKGDEDLGTNYYDISADGRWFMTYSRLWDLESEEPGETPLVPADINVGFSPDSHWFVGIDEGNIVQVWDMSAYNPFSQAPVSLERLENGIRSYFGRPYFVGADWLVTQPVTGTFHLWNLGGPASARTELPPGAVRPKAVGPGGRWLVTEDFDSPPRLWDARALSEGPATLPDGAEAVFSSDRRWMITVGISATLGLWDLASPDPEGGVVELTGPSETVPGRVFSPDSQWLVTSHRAADGTYTVQVWSLSENGPATGPVATTTTHQHVSVRAVSPGQRHVLLSSQDGLRVWNWDGTISSFAPGLLEYEGGYGTTISPDGRWLFVAGSGGGTRTGRMWDLSLPDASSSVIVLPKHRDLYTEVGLSPGDRWLITKEWYGPGYVWDMDEPDLAIQPVTFPGRAEPITVAAYSPDYRWIVSTDAGGDLYRWDLAAPRLNPEALALTIPDILTEAQSLSPDGRWLATVTPQQGETVRLWHLDDEVVIPLNLAGAGSIGAVDFSPDNRWLIVASWSSVNYSDLSHHLWWLDQLGPPIVLPGSHDPVGVGYGPQPVMALSPDGRWLATGHYDGTVHLWDLHTDNPLEAGPTILRGHKGGRASEITALAFSPDSRLLASRNWENEDRSVRIWDVSGTQPEQTTLLNGLERRIFGMVFSADNRWLLTTSESGPRSGLWDLDAQSPATAFIALPGSARYSMDMTADNSWVVTSGYRNSAVQPGVQLWPRRADLLKQTACRTAGRNLDRDEWEAYFQGQAYRKTCPDLPPNPNYLASIYDTIWNLLRSGDVEGAMMLMRNPDLEFDVKADIVPLLLRAGESAARSNELDDAVALYEQALSLDPTSLAQAPEEEARQVAVDGLIQDGLGDAEYGRLEDALAHLQEAYAVDASIDLPLLEAEVFRSAAQYHRREGERLAATGSADQARTQFEEALSLDETILGPHPEQFIQEQIAQGLVRYATNLAWSYDVRASLWALGKAQRNDPELEIPASTWDLVCRQGGISGKADLVLEACERAVALASGGPFYHDSRGLVRALTGDYAGASEDFQFYIDYLESSGDLDKLTLHRSWLEQLQAGENPFASLSQAELEEYFGPARGDEDGDDNDDDW